MTNTKAQKVSEIVKSSGGKFFSVEFVKKNGEVRKMNCRTGVKSKLKGGQVTYNGKNNDHNNIGVFEMGTDSYKCFKAESVKRIVVNGVETVFGEEWL